MIVAVSENFWDGPWGHLITLAAPVVSAILIAAWRLSSKLGAVDMIMKNYPPHLHVGSNIIYPRGLEPDATKENQWLVDRRSQMRKQ